jgi:hypothetical protein
MNILTIADGYGDSVACPAWYPDYFKWPKLLQLMTKGTTVIDLCRYGAGNEYIVNCLKHNSDPADVVFVQWAMPNRLDLVLCHPPDVLQQWQQKIQDDPIYSDNVIGLKNENWWLSSSSTVDWVQTYHHTISSRQHELRSQIWIEYADRFLENKPHGFLLTSNSEYLSEVQIDPDKWIWHQPWKGMHDWRFHSRYKDLDLGLVQPIPLIQFDFVREFFMPKFDLSWRNEKELQAVENLLFKKHNACKDKKPPKVKQGYHPR